MIIQLPILSPIAFSIWFIEIRWYSLAYIFGILFALFWLKKCNQKENFLSPKAYDDWITWAILSILLGGRLGYVLFYNFSYYLENPLESLAFWHGGMSFHGGLIGVIIGMYLFSYHYKINYLQLMDVFAVSAPIGLFLGRLANFMNMELYGRPTNSNFGIIFPNVDNLPRHPSQLYEALLEGVLTFIIMISLHRFSNLSKKHGKLSALFLILYGTFRILIENFRQPDEQIGFLFNKITAGQALSLPLIFLGIFVFIFGEKKYKNIKKNLA